MPDTPNTQGTPDTQGTSDTHSTWNISDIPGTLTPKTPVAPMTPVTPGAPEKCAAEPQREPTDPRVWPTGSEAPTKPGSQSPQPP